MIKILKITIIILYILIVLIFVTNYNKKIEKVYNKGYEKGKIAGIYESDKLCGKAIHKLTKTKCPDLYKSMVETNKKNCFEFLGEIEKKN